MRFPIGPDPPDPEQTRCPQRQPQRRRRR
jgi:hypothetical protein